MNTLPLNVDPRAERLMKLKRRARKAQLAPGALANDDAPAMGWWVLDAE